MNLGLCIGLERAARGGALLALSLPPDPPKGTIVRRGLTNGPLARIGRPAPALLAPFFESVGGLR